VLCDQRQRDSTRPHSIRCSLVYGEGKPHLAADIPSMRRTACIITVFCYGGKLSFILPSSSLSGATHSLVRTGQLVIKASHRVDRAAFSFRETAWSTLFDERTVSRRKRTVL